MTQLPVSQWVRPLSLIRRNPAWVSAFVLFTVFVVTLPQLHPLDAYREVRHWLASAQEPAISQRPPGALQVLSIEAPQASTLTPVGEFRRVSEPAHIVLRFEQDQVLGFYKTHFKGTDLSLCIEANYGDQANNLLQGTIEPAVPALEPDLADNSARFPEQQFEARFSFVRGQLKISEARTVARQPEDDSFDEVLTRLNGEYQSLTTEG